MEDADVIVALFDYSRPFDSEDEKILSILDQLEEKHIIVALNKSDLEHVLVIDRLQHYDMIEVSAKKAFVLN